MPMMLVICKLLFTLAVGQSVAALAFRGAVGELPTTVPREIGFCTGNPGYVYRAWSNETYNTDHVYSMNLREITDLRPRYQREKDYCRAFASPSQSNAPLVPFYRLWNRAHWDHFYTIDRGERDAALASGLFDDQGILGYVMSEAGCLSWPLFRLYRDDAYTTYDHFYTIDEAERDRVIASGRYKYEGIAAWVWPTCDIQGCIPGPPS